MCEIYSMMKFKQTFNIFLNFNAHFHMHYTVKAKTIEKLENFDNVSGQLPNDPPITVTVNYISGNYISNNISHNTINSSEINANTTADK